MHQHTGSFSHCFLPYVCNCSSKFATKLRTLLHATVKNFIVLSSNLHVAHKVSGVTLSHFPPTPSICFLTVNSKPALLLLETPASLHLFQFRNHMLELQTESWSTIRAFASIFQMLQATPQKLSEATEFAQNPGGDRMHSLLLFANLAVRELKFDKLYHSINISQQQGQIIIRTLWDYFRVGRNCARVHACSPPTK